MKRTAEQWRKCDPRAMATAQSEVAIEFAFQDAQHDILELLRQNAEMLAALKEVVRIFDGNPSSITDTVWCTDGPETLYDRASAAIASAEGVQK